ncbi:MAG: hypothetical protein MUE81_19955, partial [Thermoflexibacter sp.]|nr:hypothetical protein [Thermoflexibacter sp.]
MKNQTINKAKIIKYIIFAFLIYISIAIHQMFFGVAYIHIDHIDIKLVGHKSQNMCFFTHKFKEAKGFFFKFNYKTQYAQPFSPFNYFIYKRIFNKKKIKQFNVFLIDEKNIKYDVKPYLENFIDFQLIFDYINNELINKQINDISNNSQEDKNIYDVVIKPYHNLLDSTNKIAEIFDKLCVKDKFKECNYLKIIESCIILRQDTSYFSQNNG